MANGTVTYTYQAPVPPASGTGTIVRSTDNAQIPCVLANSDYQAFLAWVAAGNTAPAGWTGPKN